MNKFAKTLLVALALGVVGFVARYTLFRAGTDYMVKTVNDTYAPPQQQAQRDAYVLRARARLQRLSGNWPTMSAVSAVRLFASTKWMACRPIPS